MLNQTKPDLSHLLHKYTRHSPANDQAFAAGNEWMDGHGHPASLENRDLGARMRWGWTEQGAPRGTGVSPRGALAGPVQPSLLRPCFCTSQHHELYAWKQQLLSSGCIQHLSITALRLSLIPSTTSLPCPGLQDQGGLFPPLSRDLGAGNAGAAPATGRPCTTLVSLAQAVQGSGIGNISQLSAGH